MRLALLLLQAAGRDDKSFAWLNASTTRAKTSQGERLRNLLLTDLQSCSIRRDLQWGRRIHAKAVECGSEHIVSALIKMYAKCGSMLDARRVFDSVQKPNTVSWNALLMGYAENGKGHISLELYSKMKADGCTPDTGTYVAALKACPSLLVNGDEADGLKQVREIHLEIGDSLIPCVQSTLIDMYIKCGSMVEARRVFDRIQKPDVFSWTTLLLGYADNGEGHIALELFSQMKADGCVANSVTYVAALKACTSLTMNSNGKARCLEVGRKIHSEIGDHLNLHVQNTLVDMYAKCDRMVDAHEMFESIQKPNVVSWTALISGYADNGEGHTALELFSEMKAKKCAATHITYAAVLKACASTGALAVGRKVHSEICEFPVRVVTCLVDFYAKCGSMVESRAVFDQHTRSRNVLTWTALLMGYSSCGDTDTVFSLFETMQDLGFRPDGITFVCILLCCSHAGLVRKASQYLEAMPVQYGVSPDVFHYSCMVDALGRANQLVEAVSLVRRMPCNPNEVTWRGLLGACRKWKKVELGRMAFESLVEMDKQDSSTYVVMANLYGSRGMLEDQEKLLESKTKCGATWKQAGEAYAADEMGKMVRFSVGDEDPPGVQNKLAEFLEAMKGIGYHEEDAEEEEVLCGHCEKRAVVYGILKTPLGEPVRAFKNTRMCGACHESIKAFSKLSSRVVMVRDASRFHIFVNGNCCCGDHF